MKMFHSAIKSALLFVVLSVLVGCAIEDSPYQKTEYQMASNPAAVYCVQQGGQLETITQDSKRMTYCVLRDKSKVEQWQYYRDRSNQDSNSWF